MKPIKGWWFGGDVLPNGDGRKIEIGSTLTVDGELVMCKHGLHMSRKPIDALGYARCNIVWRVEAVGSVLHDTDKLCTSARRHIARCDATEALRKFARMCALDVIHLWNAPDIVKRYLSNGNESIRAAARDAARDAVWDAAREKQNRRLHRMLTEAIRRKNETD